MSSVPASGSRSVVKAASVFAGISDSTVASSTASSGEAVQATSISEGISNGTTVSSGSIVFSSQVSLAPSSIQNAVSNPTSSAIATSPLPSLPEDSIESSSITNIIVSSATRSGISSMSSSSRTAKPAAPGPSDDASTTAGVVTDIQNETGTPVTSTTTVPTTATRTSASTKGSTRLSTATTSSPRTESHPGSLDPSASRSLPPGTEQIEPTGAVKQNEATKLAPTITSTITDQVDSTFASLVGVTTTDPSNGSPTISFPPFVTVISTSFDAEASSYITYTHVVANPTGSLSQSNSDSSFLSNSGLVAGVFLVVGIAAASLIASLAFCCRRRRRSRFTRHQRWLEGMQRPLPIPIDPFEDPRDPPPLMRMANREGDIASWDGRRQTLINEACSPAPVWDNTMRVNDDSQGPFGDRHAVVGRAITTDESTGRISPLSLAQSSPSIYPPTLPPLAEDDETSDDSRQANLNWHSPPPRPPRSHLREAPPRLGDWYPMTPPPSVSSHGHGSSDPPSPTTDTQSYLHKTSHDDIVNRRTLLHVRSKANVS